MKTAGSFDYIAEHVLSCGRKIGYATRESAVRSASKHCRHVATGLRIYRCQLCNRWHLTKGD